MQDGWSISYALLVAFLQPLHYKNVLLRTHIALDNKLKISLPWHTLQSLQAIWSLAPLFTTACGCVKPSWAEQLLLLLFVF